jgi:predicted acyl esterase
VRAAWLPALLARESLAFLEHHLRGRGPAPRPAAVFVLGAARWRELGAWPPPARERVLHLRGADRLDEEPPAPGEGSSRFAHDPAQPLAPGLAWTTPPLAEAAEIAGAPRLELHVACDAPDADFAARLLVVDGRGTARPLCEGALRCRWREGGDAPRWLEPGAPLALSFALSPVCARVAAGRRLRLEISSSAFPRLDVNPGARLDPASARPEELQRSTQTVFHDAQRASRLLLPIAGPGESGSD